MDLTFSDVLLENELKRNLQSKHRKNVFKNFLTGILVFMAVIVLVSAALVPVYQVSESSADANLADGQILVACRVFQLEPGNLVSLYLDNQIVFSYVIGEPGDYLNQDASGAILLNNQIVENATMNESGWDASYPYQLKNEEYVLIDDNVSQLMHVVSKEKIIAKVLFRIWPLTDAGYIG